MKPPTTDTGRSRVVQVMTPRRSSSAARSRVLIDPDRPDAAHPIMPPGHDLLADHAAKG